MITCLEDVEVLSCRLPVLFGEAAGDTSPQHLNKTRKKSSEEKRFRQLLVATITPVSKINTTHPERYTISLEEDGKLQARFDCNRGGGDYQISEGKLSFGPLISTRMACPPNSQDAVFMRDLQRVQAFFVEDGFLFLELPLDNGTMKFRQAAARK